MGICKIFWDKPLHCVASFSIFSDSLKNIHGDRGWSFFVFRELQGQPTGKISLHHHLIIFSQVNAESGLFLFYLSSHPLLACYLLKYLTILYPRPFFIGLEPYLLLFLLHGWWNVWIWHLIAQPFIYLLVVMWNLLLSWSDFLIKFN